MRKHAQPHMEWQVGAWKEQIEADGETDDSQLARFRRELAEKVCVCVRACVRVRLRLCNIMLNGGMRFCRRDTSDFHERGCLTATRAHLPFAQERLETINRKRLSRLEAAQEPHPPPILRPPARSLFYTLSRWCLCPRAALCSWHWLHACLHWLHA
jgi:hypothetical protein